MTAMTLVAALASFIFLPLAQALIDAYGWRDALLVSRRSSRRSPCRCTRSCSAPRRPRHARAGAGSASTPRRARRCARAPFWLLSVAFFLAPIAAIAMTVHAIPFLLERGYGAAFAAFAVGLVGVSQIPGRLLFAPLAARLPRRVATATRVRR